MAHGEHTYLVHVQETNPGEARFAWKKLVGMSIKPVSLINTKKVNIRSLKAIVTH